MSLVLSLRNRIICKTEYLSHKKYFNEIYALINAVITIIFWYFNFRIGMIYTISVSALIIILTNDLKYILPNVINLIFMINQGFKNDEIPYELIILASSFILIIILYTIFNGIHIRNLKSFWGLFGLAVFQIIPIFWNEIIPDDKNVLYLVYLGDLLYLIIYIIFASGIKKPSISLLTTTMSYLGIIIAVECAIIVYELKDTVGNILELAYYLGWGLCNEAGILICFSIPFTFYLISKATQARVMFMQNLKIVISIIGVILTTSRGSYLCCFGLTLVLYVVGLFLTKNKIKYLQFIILFLTSIFIAVAIAGNDAIKFYNDVLDKVFYNDLDSNGRKELWILAMNHFLEKPLYTVFGSGMVSDIIPIGTAAGYQDGFWVYHSTIFETLAISGLCGFFFLLFHFVEKYRNISYVNKNFLVIIGIGYFFTDLYGFIDNTYHMYYYMIPLAIIMASVDSECFSKPLALF